MAKSVILVFPGQGAQYVEMGHKLYNELGQKAVFEKADEILGSSLSQLMFTGPQDQLTLTENAQPAILTHSTATFNWLRPILEETNTTIECCLGHSVGEYGALVAAGALSFEDGVKAVHLRGKYMQECVSPGVGAMFAILRVEKELIEQACKNVSTDEEQVMPANFNSPDQVVISGHRNACNQAIQLLQKSLDKKFRAIELRVSAPFHSSLMNPAAKKLAEHFQTITFTSPSIPYRANINAQLYEAGTNPEVVVKNLVDQVDGAVLWSQSIQQCPQDRLFIEVGPGQVLKGLLKKINPDIRCISTDTPDIEELIREELS